MWPRWPISRPEKSTPRSSGSSSSRASATSAGASAASAIVARSSSAAPVEAVGREQGAVVGRDVPGRLAGAHRLHERGDVVPQRGRARVRTVELLRGTLAIRVMLRW